MELLSYSNFQVWLPSLLVLLTAILNPTFAKNTDCEYPAIFNLGDSNSDTGGLAVSLFAPTPPYGETYFRRPAGRFSDGRLIIDFIGSSFSFHFLLQFYCGFGGLDTGIWLCNS